VANKSTRRPTAAQVADRRARVAQMRKAEQAKERRRKFLTFGGGGFVAIVVVIVIVVLAINASGVKEVIPTNLATGATYTQPMPATIANTSGISGVTMYSATVSTNATDADNCVPATVICHLHVTTPVKYALTPPIGGPHNADWMTCGVYDKPVPSDRAVHNLEHGAVWITYRPSLSKADVTTLQSFVKKQKDATLKGKSLNAKYIDLTPWASEALPSPIVISSWGAQLKLTSPTDPRLQQFVDKMRMDANQTYEVGSPCSGEPDGGTPLFS
jgi:hypothetical protein